jgi:hypothetical protein
MGNHHTKDKGDLGVAKAHADLVCKGFTVLFPATEHAPFDLVTYREGSFSRVQVKYRALRAGKVEVSLQSIWSDRHGVHRKSADKTAIDLVCIYCPDTDECYYLRPTAFRQSVSLRVTPSGNNQKVGVLLASDFRELPI